MICCQQSKAHINAYEEEIALILKILKKMIAQGFDHQKGAIFGFGKNAAKDTDKNVVEICEISE